MRAEYETQEAAREGIAAHVVDFYQSEYPQIAARRADDITEAGRVLGALYVANVYPHMNIEWGSYPDHSGHHFSPGCNRCHAGDHQAENGDVINADCSICHTIVAWDEASPEILEMIPRD